MRMTPVEYMNWLARQHKRGAQAQPAPIASSKSEAALHREIIEFCDTREPRWKFIRCRMDMASTIERGAHDFTIYASRGRVFNIECKTAKGKLSNEQRGWAHELERNGHTVHVVRSLDEFLKVVGYGEGI